MNILKRGICLLMVLVLVAGLAACGGGTEDTTSWRPDPEPQAEKEAFVDTDGDFEYTTVDWDGPDGYVIVVPAGDADVKRSAEYLQRFYKEVHEVTLQIVTDATAETEKEILVGATNRSQSAKLAENEVEAKVDGKKLVINGGHYATVDAAVGKFVRKLPEKNKAISFKLATDFTSKATPTALDGDYYYVWGDEFEWADINYSKWDFNANMGGSVKNEISWENTNIDVSDGRLKIYAIRYFNPSREGTQFRSPYSTTHAWHMNFIYGYAEIRAKIPFEKGVWPSWWGVSSNSLLYEKTDPGRYHKQVYNVEIDVYEIFGNESNVVPNIHKWYKSPYNYWTENGLEQGTNNNHTQWNQDRDIWNFSERLGNVATLDNEYHIYGYEWTPTEVSMWVNGEKYMTFDITKSYDLNKNMEAFHDPMHLMFNMHVFVDDADYQPNLIDDNLSALPAEYCVDYYRVYQKKDGKSKLWIENGVGKIEPDRYIGRDDPWKAE